MKKFFLQMYSGLMIMMIFANLRLSAQVSQTPPMGWNSYDSKNYSVTEAEVEAIADTMASKYLRYGWQYLCIDWGWYFPGMSTGSPDQVDSGGTTTISTRDHMDAYGRFMPDTVRFPSSVGGAGFGPLATYVHGKGLKFGIHILRGIPRQAVWAGTPILGTGYVARNAADTVTSNDCPWNNQMFGLYPDTAAAQAYLKSIFALYASWGVDFIKVDDLMDENVTPYTTFKTHVTAYHNAIDSCGRAMVFSTSPGATPIGDSAFFEANANQWRMANDLWDNWANVDTMLSLFVEWYRCSAPGHFPDADMIPIGYIEERGPTSSTPRWSNLTRNQQYLLMTIWCIGRSPLIWGGDLTRNRPSEDSLMTNPEVLAVNQQGVNSRPITVTANGLTWASDNPLIPGVEWVALVNRSTSSAALTVNLSAIGMASCTARNLWTRSDIAGTFTASFSQTIAAQSAGLYELTPPATSVVPRLSGNSHPAFKSETSVLIVGNRFDLPDYYAATPVKLEVFDFTGKRIASLPARGGVVDLRKVGATGSAVYLVRIRPVQGGE
jgi:hypothetical protein